METIITVLLVFALGVLALTVFGMTITKKAIEDFEWLSGFVDRCDKSEENKDAILEEYSRLLESGRIPTEMLEELRRRIIKKFK
jgi:hypothetical protein